MERCRIRFTFSLAVCLYDAFTGRPAEDPQLCVSVAGSPQKPVRKQDGFYVFSGLPPGEKLVTIRSRVYFDQTIQLLAGEKTSIAHIPLLPRASYAYPPRTTGLRLKVADQRGMAQSLVSIKAIPTARECMFVRAMEPLKRGGTEVRVTGKIALISPGDWLLLASANSGQEEYVMVRDKDDFDGWLALQTPLKHDYEQGAGLYPVSQGMTDETGEAILGFRQFAARQSAVRLVLERDGRVAQPELPFSLTEGNIHNLGNIAFP